MTRSHSYDLTPRERPTRHGVGCLSDAELLSPVVRARGGRDALEIAASVLAEIGGFGPLAVLEAHPLDRSYPFGNGGAAQLDADLTIVRRHLGATLAVLTSLDDVRRYLAMHLGGLPHEISAVLLLDNRHPVNEYREPFHGPIDSAAVYPREVVKRCLSRNAAVVILAQPPFRNGGTVRHGRAVDAEARRRCARARRRTGARFPRRRAERSDLAHRARACVGSAARVALLGTVSVRAARTP